MSSLPKPRFGVEPISGVDLEVEAPFCPHGSLVIAPGSLSAPPSPPAGPTLVFERYYADREPRKFFACALHRDRKGCPFFHWTDERASSEKRER